MAKGKKRLGTSERATRETRVKVSIDLDGKGAYELSTGIGFFDHMLAQLAAHSLFDLKVEAQGDLEVDPHHTVEDVGIALGQAFAQALGDHGGIARFASNRVPMGEALAEAALDLCGRPHLVFAAPFHSDRIGELDTALVEEFLRAFTTWSKATLHIAVPYGSNDHHIAEAIFKALALSLGEATRPAPRRLGVPSTKGLL